MSALDNKPWSDVSGENLSSKYEKCRNITEEIYKRINITFEIKKLENAGLSDESEHSDLLDSNLSNETDLFACDKTDSLPSSEEKECTININNNVEPRVKEVQKVTNYRRPRKRFRKRVKKHQSKSKASDSDGSSDEAPLSRIVDTQCVADSPESVMGVPGVIILTKDVKPKTQSPDKKTKKNKSPNKKVDQKTNKSQSIDKSSTDKKADTQTIDKNTEKHHNTPSTERENTEFDTQNSLKIIIDKKEIEKMIIDKLSQNSTIADVVEGVIDQKLGIGKTIDKNEVDNPLDKVSHKQESQKGKSLLEAKEKTQFDTKNCPMCSLSFRGDRGLRRHMAMTHIISDDIKPSRTEREVKPA